MRLSILFLSILASLSGINAQELRAYQLYDSSGTPLNYAKAFQEVADSKVILFGELHNNPICHWLQLELTKSLLTRESNLVLGAEMLERDNQEPINLYLQDSIDQKGLDSLARLWNNYATDYKPLVDLAKKEEISFIATNVPRRYARMVYREGFKSLDSLPQDEEKWLAPLPIAYNPDLPGYQKMLEMMGGHGGENLPKAQALKDATMAYSIYSNLPEQGLFLHFNGDYHSANFEGIMWYLQEKDSTLKIKTISTVLQTQTDSLDYENEGRADLIIVVDEDMTTTY